MPHRSNDRDDEDYDDDQAFDDHDTNVDDRVEDEEATVACPYCGEEIYEDAQWCPYCESYVSREDAPRARQPWWLVAGVLVCLALVVSWFFL